MEGKVIFVIFQFACVGDETFPNPSTNSSLKKSAMVKKQYVARFNRHVGNKLWHGVPKLSHIAEKQI